MHTPALTLTAAGAGCEDVPIAYFPQARQQNVSQDPARADKDLGSSLDNSMEKSDSIPSPERTLTSANIQPCLRAQERASLADTCGPLGARNWFSLATMTVSCICHMLQWPLFYTRNLNMMCAAHARLVSLIDVHLPHAVHACVPGRVMKPT